MANLRAENVRSLYKVEHNFEGSFGQTIVSVHRDILNPDGGVGDDRTVGDRVRVRVVVEFP